LRNSSTEKFSSGPPAQYVHLSILPRRAEGARAPSAR
jgi:hypothetical protein